MRSRTPRRSIPSRIFGRFPGGREALWNAYSRTPYPISRLILAIGRSRFLFPDNRAPYFRKVFDHVRDHKVQGDYLEFGVFRGQSFIMAYQLARHLDMRFYAFDSFEGLPRDEELWKRGDFRADANYFLRSIQKAGVDLRRVVLVPGYYEELSPSSVPSLERAAVIHIDCDLYSSTREALRLVEGVIGPGTVVIFDDWFLFQHEPNPAEHGEQRAFHEWKEANRFEPFLEAQQWHKSFVCTR